MSHRYGNCSVSQSDLHLVDSFPSFPDSSFSTLLRRKARWRLPTFPGRSEPGSGTGWQACTGRNGVPGFAGLRKDAPRFAAGCFTANGGVLP